MSEDAATKRRNFLKAVIGGSAAALASPLVSSEQHEHQQIIKLPAIVGKCVVEDLTGSGNETPSVGSSVSLAKYMDDMVSVQVIKTVKTDQTGGYRFEDLAVGQAYAIGANFYSDLTNKSPIILKSTEELYLANPITKKFTHDSQNDPLRKPSGSSDTT